MKIHEYKKKTEAERVVFLNCPICLKKIRRCRSYLEKLKNPPTCGNICRGKSMTGDRRWNWKGGKTKKSEGYIIINKTGTLEHKEVMEKYLKRKLQPNEIVHHKNGKRDDNRLENLEVINRGLHIMKYHSKRDKKTGKLVSLGFTQ